MFTRENMQTLLQNRPFAPFRLFLSDGGSVDVRSPEQVMVVRHYAVAGLLDPEARDSVYDRHLMVWYMHVTRVEMLTPGAPPGSPPQDPSATPSPAPA
jgi:hypothetical protein